MRNGRLILIAIGVAMLTLMVIIQLRISRARVTEIKRRRARAAAAREHERKEYRRRVHWEVMHHPQATRVSQKKDVAEVGWNSVALVMSTMKRGLKVTEHVYATIDSLVDSLGSKDGIDIHLVVLVVDSDVDDLQRRYQQYIDAGVITLKPMLDVESYYSRLTETCRLHRCWNDSLDQVIWRSKRSLDFVASIRAAAPLARYLFIMEDDTPFQGSDFRASLQRCLDVMEDEKRVCQFGWAKKRGGPNVHRTADDLASPMVQHAGMFAMMMQSSDWSRVARYMLEHFDKAPCDWLLGRWLFRHRFLTATLKGETLFYHAPAGQESHSSKHGLKARLSSNPLFRGRSLTWQQCLSAKDVAPEDHPLKWDLAQHVGFGYEHLWLEAEALDVNPALDNELPQPDTPGWETFGMLVRCEELPECQVVNSPQRKMFGPFGSAEGVFVPHSMVQGAGKSARVYIRVEEPPQFSLQLLRSKPAGA